MTTGQQKRDTNPRSAAFWGLAGTILGAVIGLGGTWMLMQTTVELDEKATKRAAFAVLLTEAQDYRGQLRLLREAAASGNQATYDRQRTTTQNAGGELYAAAGVVRIVASDQTGRAGSAVNDRLIEVDKPENISDYDVQKVTAQLEAVGDALNTFLDLARAEVGDS